MKTMRELIIEIDEGRFIDRSDNTRLVLQPSNVPLSADTPVLVCDKAEPMPDGWKANMSVWDIKDWLRSWDDLPTEQAVDACLSYLVELENLADEWEAERKAHRTK